MKDRQSKEHKEQKKTYKKPLLKKHTKLTDITTAFQASGAAPLGCTRF
jgi:hypothetical protein